MKLGIRRPRFVAALWVAGTLVLAGIGATVEQRLHRSDLTVPGTAAAEAQQLAQKHFGDAQSLVVMLEGPPASLDAQGRVLAQRIERRPKLDVVGPWVPGTSDRLRPRADRAVILVRAGVSFDVASKEISPFLRETVDETIRRPVRGYVSGYPDVGAGVHEASVEALKRAEIIAAPLLLIVLLLVFRSPVAASLPLALGVATIVGGRGVLDLINRFTELDVVALNMASMMGLALGVDYSLVMVSRFREELAAGRPTAEAVATAGRTAGKTILFAGIALGAAMAAAGFVAPGGILVSSGVGVVVSCALSVLGAVVALPALLMMLGPRVNKWSFGSGGEPGGRWSDVALRAVSRPAIAAGAILVFLGALAAPALALSWGGPDPRALPESSPHRSDFERVLKTLGGGWSAPYEVVVAAKSGRITDPERLQALGRWQEDLGRSRQVKAVFGPEPIADRMKRLRGVQRSLSTAARELDRAKRDQKRLAGGLSRVDAGVGEMQRGLAAAADGARRLASGAGQGTDGAARLEQGLDLADRGAAKLQDGLGEAATGAGALADGSARLRRGSAQISAGLARALREARAGLPGIARLRGGLEDGSRDLGRLREPAQGTVAALADARRALDRMIIGAGTPQWLAAQEAIGRAQANMTGRNPLTGARVRDGYEGMDASLAQASNGLAEAAAGVGRLERGSKRLVSGLARLERGSRRLQAGIARLDRGARELRQGIARLRNGGGELASGLDRLAAGGDQLAGGARRLSTGADRLAGGLGDGEQRVGALGSGVDRIERGVAAGRKRTQKLGAGLGGGDIQTSLFDSGYLPLAAIESQAADVRKTASFAVNIERGGSAARIVVMTAAPDPSNPGDPLRKRLERDAERIGKETGTTALVGGPATLLQDFETETASRFWWLILALTATTYLVLVPVLRSLLLPLLAVALNLVTVFAALGVLVLGFQGAAPLGGPGDIDGIMVLAIVGVVFGLSIDYEVFLLARMREGYSLTGTTEGAIEYGLRHTAGVITGAALIMTGVFVAFAMADIASMRQLGVGLSVAVLLDATVVRLILLPAVIRMAGGACWWLPGPLRRVLGDDARPPATEAGPAESPTRGAFSKFAAHPGRGEAGSDGGGGDDGGGDGDGASVNGSPPTPSEQHSSDTASAAGSSTRR